MVSNASRVEDQKYQIILKKLSTTATTFKSTGEILSISYALLGIDKIGDKKSLVYDATSVISETQVVITIDLSSLYKEGANGDEEVVVFYNAGKGTSGDNSEDKKYLSENFMPVMIKVSLSSPLGIMVVASIIFLLIIYDY